MNDIKNLLEDFQNKPSDIDDLMASILNNYILKINNDTYNFCEIELYYYNKNKEKFKDCGVLKREKEAGDIFFHRYGFDICFTSKKNNNGELIEYGGILVRSLKKDDEYILGPWNCSYDLLNTYHATLCISLDKKDKEMQTVCKTTRIRSSCIDNKLYRYTTIQACQDIQNTKKQEYQKYWTKIEKSECQKVNND